MQVFAALTLTNDHLVNLVQQVLNQKDLVADLRMHGLVRELNAGGVGDACRTHTHLGTAEDGDKGALWVINGCTKVVKLLLEKEASHLGRQVDAHHGAVSAMSSAEGIVDWRRANTRM